MQNEKVAALLKAGLTLTGPGATPGTAAPARMAPGMISVRGKEIEVKFPYNLDLVNKCRAIKQAHTSAWFNGATRAWHFPKAALDAVLDAFPTFDTDDEIGVAVKDREREAAEQIEAEMAQWELTLKLRKAVDIDSHFLKLACQPGTCDIHPEGSNGEEVGHPLRQHQKDFFLAATEEHRLICADDMGLGKTIESLTVAKAYREVTGCSVYVIARKGLRKDPWIRDAKRVNVEVEFFTNHATKIPAPPMNQPFFLIVDEAHDYQTKSAKRTKALMALAEAETCIGAIPLSGSPIKNGRPVNMLPLLKVIRHDMVATSDGEKDFMRRYCNAHSRTVLQRDRKTGELKEIKIWDTTGASHLDELHIRLGAKMMRRLKKNCTDLPPKTRMLHSAELTPEAEKVYADTLQRLVREYRERLRRGEIKEGGEVLVQMTQLRHAGSIGKVDAAVDLTLELTEQDRQVVLFTEFTDSAKMIRDRLEAEGIPTELLTGEVNAEPRYRDRPDANKPGAMVYKGESDRDAMVRRFQSGESRVFIGTVKAGGVGLDLFAADTVILVDRPWTPGDAVQAEDRLHRIGQTKNVTAIWIQYGEIDELVDTVLVDKQDRIDMVLEGKRKTMRGTGSVADVARLFLDSLAGEE